MIIFSLIISIAIACKSLSESESINLENGKKQELCFKVNTNLPTIVQLVNYEDEGSKKKKKKGKTNKEEEEVDENILIYEEVSLGQCKLKQGQKICYFEQGKDKLEVDLKCTKGPCKFNLIVMQEEIKQLQIGAQQKSKLKLLKIAQNSNYRVVYSIKCNNCVMKLIDANLYYYGEQPTILDRDTRYIAVFYDGIDSETIMVLTGEQEFEIERFEYVKQQRLNINQVMIDALEKSKKNEYIIEGLKVIKLKSHTHDIMKIKVKNQQGEVILDQIIDTFQHQNYNLLWNEDFNTLELSSSKKISYQIEVIDQTDIITIESSDLAMGQQYGIVNYKLKLPNIQDNHFTVSADSGEDVSVQVKSCKGNKCEAIEKIKNGESSQSVEQKCDNPDKDKFCWFVIAINTQGIYSLNIDDNNEAYMLTENQMINSEIDEEQKHHYKFNLANSQNYSSVIFRVTSENVQILISKSSKCQLVNWKCYEYSGTSEQPIILSDSQLKDGQYSITIEGMELAKYGFIIETHPKDKINIVNIKKGQIYKSSINSNQKKQCFKYEQSTKGVLTLLIHGPNQKLISYANIDTDDEIPTKGDYDVITGNSALQLVSDRFIACVEIQVQNNQDVKNETYYNDIKYSLILYDAQSVINLEFNSAYYGQVAFTEQQRFSFLSYFDEDVVYITKNILSSGDVNKELQVYIGNMLYENLDQYDYKFFDNEVSTFSLSSEKMKKLCDINEDESISVDHNRITHLCEIFIVVKSLSKTPVRYTLTIHKQDLAIQLTDGLQQSYNLQHIEEFMHFYYQPNSKSIDINLFASTFYGKFVLHINIWKLDTIKHKSDWPFIDKEDDSDISSGSTNQIHRTIKSTALDQCWPDCVLLISIQSVQDSQLNVYNYNDQFHIMINQGMQDVIEGQKYEVSIKSEECVYFTFKNLQKFRDDAYLTFSLLQIIGNGYFTITVNGGDKFEYPNLYGSFDFHADGTYFQLSKDKLNEKLKEKEISIQDAYLIISISGLQSYYNSIQQSIKLEFTISYMNMDYIQIMHSQPNTINAKYHQPTIVQFYNYLNQDIFFKLHRFLGYGSMSVFICNKQSNIAECVKDSNDAEFKYLDTVLAAGNENSQILIKSNDKTKFCIYCTYIIKIESQESELHGQLTVVLDNDFVKLPAGVQYSDYVEKQSSSQFSIFFTQDSKIEIFIQIFTGDPIVQYSFNQDNLNSSKIIKAQPNNKYIHITVPSQKLLNDLEDIAQGLLNKNKNKKQEDEIEIGLLPSHFVHDELFLKVTTKSNDPCNYTIYYTSDFVNGKLQDGRIHLAIIENNITFLYENYDQQISVLNLSPLNQTSLQDIEIKVLYIKKQSFDDYHYEFLEEIPIKTRLIHPLSSSYELPKDNGIYEIILKNKKYIENGEGTNPTQFIEISASTNDIRILPIQRHHSGYIQPTEFDYYETYAPSEGYLAVEIYSCSSDINFSFSKADIKSFIDEDYDESVDIPEKDYHVEMISVDKGTLWIAIKGISTSPAYYHITNHFYQNKKDIPFGKIMAGNDGHIKWHLDKSKADSIQIEFEHATCNKCNLDGVQINYHIFIAQDEKKLQMLGYCGNEQFENHKADDEKIFKKSIQSYRLADHNGSIVYEIEFPNLVTYEYASVGVFATVDNFMNSTSQIKVFYRTIQVPVPNYFAKFLNHNRTFFTFLIFGMILLIALLTLWLCYYIKRYRNTKNKLDFQLEQGAKIIASSRLPQNDDAAFQNDFKMKYQTFEED
ncbi:unnamed protein product [Paramecium primaurelia]|uniref:Transmembrane protein n=1 Tax=Paramecium primaurelia TaxID=5886 RepID=A0A8S1NJA3_PARPR|nr:unnamed protein product [Paramecium primaurelia]